MLSPPILIHFELYDILFLYLVVAKEVFITVSICIVGNNTKVKVLFSSTPSREYSILYELRQALKAQALMEFITELTLALNYSYPSLMELSL
ncbi:hypothetical protein CR513_61866, partial [Mucuna pruriens]